MVDALPEGEEQGVDAVPEVGKQRQARGSSLPLSRDIRVGPLDTAGKVRGELARIYRLARRGQLPLDALRSFVYTLTAICKVIEGSDHESRLRALELMRERGEGDDE